MASKPFRPIAWCGKHGRSLAPLGGQVPGLGLPLFFVYQVPYFVQSDFIATFVVGKKSMVRDNFKPTLLQRRVMNLDHSPPFLMRVSISSLLTIIRASMETTLSLCIM